MQNLKLFTLVCVLLLKISFASAKSDTSGVYLTKTDFITNTIQYKSEFNIPEPLFPLLSRFVISGDAVPITIKLKRREKKTFDQGAIFGFYNNGVKYLFLKQSNEYAAVVSDTEPVFMVVKAEEHYSGKYSFSDDKYLFTKNLDDSFKEFTNENITTDFRNHKKEMDLLLELRQKIIKDGYDAEIHKRAFLKCRKLVSSYIEKLKKST